MIICNKVTHFFCVYAHIIRLNLLVCFKNQFLVLFCINKMQYYYCIHFDSLACSWYLAKKLNALVAGLFHLFIFLTLNVFMWEMT